MMVEHQVEIDALQSNDTENISISYYNKNEHPGNIILGAAGLYEKYDRNHDDVDIAALKKDCFPYLSVPMVFFFVLTACLISASWAIIFVVGNFVVFAESDGRQIPIYSFDKSSFIFYQIAGLLVYLYMMIHIVKCYIRYLELYTTFIFNYDYVRQYNIQSYIKWVSIILVVVFVAIWSTSVAVWSITFTSQFTQFYDANHAEEDFKDKAQTWIDKKLLDLTSTNSVQLTSFSLLMLSPVWILFLIFLLLTIIISIKIGRTNNNNCLSRSLLLNDSVSIQDNDQGLINGANSININAENKKYLYRVLLIHILLLITWILWKWFVSPLSIVVSGSFLQGFILKAFTTLTKFICHKLCDVNDSKQPLLFRSQNMKIIISISTSVLFAFGLKFVFSNIKTWSKFFGIAILLSCWKIINGSFKSHLFGKQCINTLKRMVNKILDKCCCCCCCSKRLTIDVFDTIDDEIEFNKWLAFDISVQFIISASSCLVVMVYFAMFDGIFWFQHFVNHRVYELLSASFGIDCLVFFIQIALFLKRDRKYFVSVLGKRFEYETSWTPDKTVTSKCCGRGHVVEQKDKWIRFLSITIALSWFWIGNMTGQPAIWQHT